MTLRRVYKISAIILIPLAVISVFFGMWKLAFSILAGGGLAVLNFSGLSRGLENLLGTYKPAIKLLFFSIIRLFIVSAIIIVLAKLRLVNLVGLAGGFSVVLSVLLLEGLKTARNQE